MKTEFPEKVCAYSRRLAASSPRFALQAYDGEAGRRDAGTDDGYGPDPFGELAHASKCHGLKQRFPDRVLVMTTDRCFMNCRHCTRRGLLGSAEVVRTRAQLDACIAYVRSHPDVRDVLLSGGDILTLPDAAVFGFVEAFAALDQVDVVRVCTRAPCTNPARVTRRLAQGLGKTGKVWVNTQFNCADEVTEEAKRAAARLVGAGIPVSCQTVLLRGVNDSAGELLRLFRALSAARIRPYYVFQCDPVAGISRFRVPLEKAVALERECAGKIGGLSLPRFVADVPGAGRKMPVAELLQGEQK
ncbi:MAG: radical SAM protein [Kiritimatiellae bacterium]|nr:radical SAM protein [Kiritimatiellia bacterium]